MNRNMKPLLSGSQGSSVNVLYFDSQAGDDDLYECVTVRLNALLNLNSELARLNPEIGADMGQLALSELNSILLSDAITILNHLHSEGVKVKCRERYINLRVNEDSVSENQEVRHA